MMIAALSVGYIIYAIVYQKDKYVVRDAQNNEISIDAAYLWDYVSEQVSTNFTAGFLLVLSILLVAVNWGCEMVKWKMLLGKITKVTTKLSVISILSGVAASVFTPYRVGGYFGRVAHLRFRDRIRGVVLLLLGDISQFLITMFLGSLSLFFLIYGSDLQNNSGEKTLLQGAALIIAFMVLLFIGLFVNMHLFVGLFDRIKWLSNWKKYWGVLSVLRYRRMGFSVLGISSIRYLTITLQYVLTLWVFEVDLSLFDAITVVGGLFIIYHFLPTFNILELGLTKSAIVIYLLESFIYSNSVPSDTAIIITCASFLIWLFNLAIPSLIGSVFLLRIKVLKEQ